MSRPGLGLPGPLYRQIKSHIAAQIETGRWSPGSRVPSENQLVAEFGISRMTANRALRELTHAGYLNRIPGVGSFVREPRQTSLLELRNIADDISQRGNRHTARIVSLKRLKANRERTAAFGVKRGSVIFYLEMVHEENGLPVQLEQRYVNPAVVPRFLSQDFTAMTPTAYLLSVAPVDELEHAVRAVMPGPSVCRLLKIPKSVPCLELDRRSWSRGSVVTEATLTYPANRYELRSRYRTTASGDLGRSASNGE